jgi:hypothetical protein
LKALGLSCSEDWPFEINQMPCAMAKLLELLDEERKTVKAKRMRLQAVVCEYNPDIKQHNERMKAPREMGQKIENPRWPMSRPFTER